MYKSGCMFINLKRKLRLAQFWFLWGSSLLKYFKFKCIFLNRLVKKIQLKMRRRVLHFHSLLLRVQIILSFSSFETYCSIEIIIQVGQNIFLSSLEIGDHVANCIKNLNFKIATLFKEIRRQVWRRNSLRNIIKFHAHWTLFYLLKNSVFVRILNMKIANALKKLCGATLIDCMRLRSC